MNGHSSSGSGKAARDRLGGRKERRFWKGVEELSGDSAIKAFLRQEFPGLATSGLSLDRRSLLKVMGASLALAGLSACAGEEDETAYPYVNAPEGTTPGQARWYATAVTFAGYAQPVLGKTVTGRPVKLEGNPDHPASKGKTDAFTQAALIGLYDPRRSQSPRHLDKPATWDAFDAAMSARAAALDAVEGEGFRLLTGPTTSPTLARQIAAMMQRWPKARWHVCDPVTPDGTMEGTARVFGGPLALHPAFDAAETVVSLDDDFLGPGPRQTLNAGLFSERRRLRQSGEGACHLFVAEPTPSATGSMADERLPASISETGSLLQEIAAQVGFGGIGASGLSERQRTWVSRASAALRAARGRALVLVGPHHAAELQALALLINERLGSFGTTLRFTDPVLIAPPDGANSLKALAEDMRAGRVTTLAVIGANPAYASPVDLGFGAAMERVELRIHAGLHFDETASLSHWHAPLQHDLESWSDARAVDGSASIIQPLVRPFYDVRSPHVVLENLLGHAAGDRDLVQATWRNAWVADFDRRWRDSLYRGIAADSAAPFLVPSVVDRSLPASSSPTGELTACIRPDAGVWDGAFSENAWAQETPRPLTKITWGNVILISPRLAEERGLENGDEAMLSVGDASLTGPVWIMPGQEYRTLTVTLGYGRRMKDAISDGLGYDAYLLRQSGAPWHRPGVAIEPVGNKQVVATTQLYQAMDGFDFVRTVDAAALAMEPVVGKVEPPSLYPDRPKHDPSWGMSIDLDLCVGCNACVTACQAENNIPVVGKELAAQGREMHWLRIDHYHEGAIDEPNSYFQPIPCMHCEQAPCEMGCPVNAAVHSIDGLNLQVYNRCIGTRTCSSYCPYKVRRFNWFDFTGDDPESVRAMRNPDVTVRSRGVMEKCTYCVQRIAQAEITADKEGRPIRDGEIVTACQQACPTQAIVFGNVSDPDSTVSRRKAEARDYALLEEANTRPRTTYLARIEERAPVDGQAG